MRSPLEIHLRRLAHRMRLMEALCFGTRGLGAGLAAALTLALVARLVPLATVAMLAPLGLVLALVGALLGVAVAWVRPRPLSIVARTTDHRLSLQARLATAWAIANGDLLTAESMARAQLADALRVAEGVDPRVTFPLRPPRREGAAVLALALALFPALLLPNPQEATLAHRAAVREAVADQVAGLERLQAELAGLEELPETEAGRQLLAELEELERTLAEGNPSQEEAVAALSEAEAKLRRLQDAHAAAWQAAMQEAGRRVGQTASTDVNQVLAQALAQGDADLAASILADLADEEGEPLSREEELALASALEQAAEALSASDPGLAENLAQAAQAIREGEIGAARESLAQASEQMAQAGQEMQAQQAASRAAEQIQQGRQAVAGAGQQGGAGQAGQPGGGEGQAGQGAQGSQSRGQEQQGSGQGAGAAPGQNGTGAGSGRGDPGQPGEGGTAGGQMPTNNGPNQGLERAYEPIYAPHFLGGEESEQIFLPGATEAGDEALPVPGQGGTPGEALVPYNAVYATYRDAAAEALDDSFVPLGMKEIVRQYFSSLEP